GGRWLLVTAAGTPVPPAATFTFGLQILEVFNHDLELGALFAAGLVVPLVELQVAFNKNLLPLVQSLLNTVRQLERFAAVEGFTIEENWLIFPIAGLAVFFAIIDSEAKGGHFAAVREGARFGVAGQATDQHHLVQVGHWA